VLHREHASLSFGQLSQPGACGQARDAIPARLQVTLIPEVSRVLQPAIKGIPGEYR
jgi:hypothetical protein